MDKNEIEKIITQLRNNSTVKKSKQILADIQNIDSRLNEDVFKLAVVGEFSSGKSTFINAIIGMYNVPLVKTQMKKIIVTAKTLYSHPKNVSKIYAALHTDLAW